MQVFDASKCIYDPFARIDASSQLGDASAQLRDASNFTLKYSSIFRRSVISTWRRVRSTPRRVKNAIMTPMAYHRIRGSLSLESFKSNLKTLLFKENFYPLSS